MNGPGSEIKPDAINLNGVFSRRGIGMTKHARIRDAACIKSLKRDSFGTRHLPDARFEVIYQDETQGDKRKMGQLSLPSDDISLYLAPVSMVLIMTIENL